MFGFKISSYYLLRLILSNLILISLISLVGCSDENLDLSKKYYKEGVSYFNRKEYHQAIDAFKKSSELIPFDDPAAYNMIGLAYKELGDYKSAMMWFEKAIESDAQCWISYIHIGDIYAESEDYDKATVWYAKTKEINPKAELPYMKLWDIFLKQGKVEKAIDECKNAIEKLAPYTSEPHLKLGDIYAEKGLYNEAIIEWTTAKKDPYYKKIYKEYDPVKERLEKYKAQY